MKKILFAATALAAALFASCDKDNDTINPALPETSDGARIAITLTGADEADTRAFFDASAKAEFVGILALVALGSSPSTTAEPYHPPGLHLVGTLVQVCDLLASQICSRHRVLVLRRCELRRLVGQDPRSPYGFGGEVGRRL